MFPSYPHQQSFHLLLGQDSSSKTVLQQVKKLSAFHGTWRSTEGANWDRWIQTVR